MTQRVDDIHARRLPGGQDTRQKRRENAQDEASITVIATGLDMQSETPVSKVMTNFSNSNYKQPRTAPASHTQTVNQEAAATAAKMRQGMSFESTKIFSIRFIKNSSSVIAAMAITAGVGRVFGVSV